MYPETPLCAIKTRGGAFSALQKVRFQVNHSSGEIKPDDSRQVSPSLCLVTQTVTAGKTGCRC